MAGEKPNTPKPVQHDRPEVSETYVDSLIGMGFDAGVVKLEFVVKRMQGGTDSKAPVAHQYTACRLVMPLQGYVDLLGKTNALTQVMEKQGILKKNQQIPSEQAAPAIKI